MLKYLAIPQANVSMQIMFTRTWIVGDLAKNVINLGEPCQLGFLAFGTYWTLTDFDIW